MDAMNLPFVKRVCAHALRKLILPTTIAQDVKSMQLGIGGNEMTWNYRLIKHTTYLGERQVEYIQYTIHEVYYDDSGSPESWTEDAIAARGDSYADAQSDYLMMADAFTRPALVINDSKPYLREEVNNNANN